MRLFKGKLGTDKPIEIFIALFVILAVAMVILKMFSSQIEKKKTEMEQQQQFYSRRIQELTEISGKLLEALDFKKAEAARLDTLLSLPTLRRQWPSVDGESLGVPALIMTIQR